MKYSKLKRLTIFIVCYLSYTAVYIARMNLSVASVKITESGIATTAEIGVLGTAFAVIYAVGRLINGRLGDKIEPKLLISSGLFLTALSNFVLYFSPSYPLMILLWGINAYGQSMLWGAILRATTEAFGKENAKNATAAMVSSVATGSILGILVNTFIIKTLGVEYAFLIPAVIACVCFACTLILVPSFGNAEKPDNEELAENSDNFGDNSYDSFGDNSDKPKKLTFKQIFCDSLVRKEFLPVFLHGVVKDNVSFWMTMYFVSAFGIDLSKIALLSVFIPLAGLLGRLIFPVLYKLFKNNEHAVSVFSFGIAAAASAGVALTRSSAIFAAACLGIIYAALSVVNTAELSVFPLRFAKRGGASTVSGLMDLCAYSGYGFGSLVFGYMIEPFGYSSVFWAWTALSVVGLFAIFIPQLKKERNKNV